MILCSGEPGLAVKPRPIQAITGAFHMHMERLWRLPYAEKRCNIKKSIHDPDVHLIPIMNHGSMGQLHLVQQGAFHVTTNAHWRVPWCTVPGVPHILVDNLFMTRNVYQGKVYAFCVMSDHMHMIINPGERGLSRFVQSFKSHCIVEAHKSLASSQARASPSSPLRINDQVAVSMNAIRWQKGFHARGISGEQQWDATMAYVQWNPVRHGRVQDIGDWRWSSLHFPHLVDWHEAY